MTDEEMSRPNQERRLTRRFLTLPFRHQIAVAKNLNILTDRDLALNSEKLFQELFKRVHEEGLLRRFRDEIERYRQMNNSRQVRHPV